MRQAKSLDLPVKIYHPVNDRNPVIVLTWVGSEPDLPSIVLNSHMDVVPVFREHWKHSPFAAEMDEDGKIFARGAQDMKCCGMQYLAAIRELKRDGVQQFKRTIHIMYVPDEELGGLLGMMKFCTSDEFKALNVGFSLDEGMASPTEEFNVFYAERCIWQVTIENKGNEEHEIHKNKIKLLRSFLFPHLLNYTFIPFDILPYFSKVVITCFGQSGHGSLLFKNTPGEKIHYIIDKFMNLRKMELAKLENNPELTIGDCSTVNLTMLNGGSQANVVPPSLSATFDIRLANDVDLDEFNKKVSKPQCELLFYEQSFVFILFEIRLISGVQRLVVALN